MNAPTEQDLPDDTLERLDDGWTVEADMKRLELWHDDHGHVVVTDAGEHLSVTPWIDHESGSSEQAYDSEAAESQETAAAQAAEFALDLERTDHSEDTSFLDSLLSIVR